VSMMHVYKSDKKDSLALSGTGPLMIPVFGSTRTNRNHGLYIYGYTAFSTY
jgi:hypothetical protein